MVSLANTEAGEDAPQQIVAAEGTGDLAQSLLRHTQILGQQFTRAHQGELVAAVLEVLLRLQQRFEVAPPRARTTSDSTSLIARSWGP